MNVNASIDSILQTSLERLAEIGVAEAQYRLGKQYQEGDTLPEDQEMAFGWMMKAAEGEHPRALLEVALSLTRGVGVSIDMPRAVEYYERAAKHDVMEAAWRLGDILLDGRGVMKDPAKARVYYEQACNSKDRVLKRPYSDEAICPEAEWSLGVMLEDGIGGECNVEAAKSHYARVTGFTSVEGRDLAAMELRYAKLLDKGPHDFEAYARAARLGSICAMREYVSRSQDHYISHSRDDDDTFSPSLFKDCLDRLVEIAASKAASGSSYSRPDYSMSGEEFYRVVRFLIRTGEVRACYVLAKAYSEGRVLPKSMVNEFRSYRIAHRLKTRRKPDVGAKKFSDRYAKLLAQVENGEVEACAQLWEELLSRKEIYAPPEVVDTWRKKAAAIGVPRAVEERRRLEAEAARQAFEEKLPCIMRSSRFDAELTWKVVGDMRYVCKWSDLYACASRAAELGNATAMVWTARMLMKGTPDVRGSYGPVKKGVPKDHVLAKQWFEKAELQGELSAEDKYNFAECLSECVPVDEKKITQLYEESASCGYVGAQLALAKRLIHGDGCAVDMTRAKELLEKSECFEALSVLAQIFNKERNVQEELNCYERMLDCCEEMIEEERSLLSKRDKLWSGRGERDRWDFVYGEDLRKVTERRSAIRSSAVAIIRLCGDGGASADQVRKAWKCLSCDSVTFPDSGKGASASSSEGMEEDDEFVF